MENQDNWKHRAAGMQCHTCMFWVRKIDAAGNMTLVGRCRRNAPSPKGFVPTFESDWCGEHRLDENAPQCARPERVHGDA